MPSQVKIELKEHYDAILKSKPNFIMTRYSGLDVATLTEIRKKLSDGGFTYRVVKNKVFHLSVKDKGETRGIPETPFTGPIAVAFAGDDIGTAAKLLKDFSKTQEKFKMVGGVMESVWYDESKVESLASLPTREEVLAKLMATLNAPAQQMAGIMNNITASLARAIKAVGEKNG